jgi:hypothetical protein
MLPLPGNARRPSVGRGDGARFAQRGLRAGRISRDDDEDGGRNRAAPRLLDRPHASAFSEFFTPRQTSVDRLQVTGEQPAAAGVIVRSQIVKANGEPVNLDYMMRRNGNTWMISDIYLDGAISEVATRRSEFAAILKNEGIDGLIAALNRKADILTGTTARSF